MWQMVWLNLCHRKRRIKIMNGDSRLVLCPVNDVVGAVMHNPSCDRCHGTGRVKYSTLSEAEKVTADKWEITWRVIKR